MQHDLVIFIGNSGEYLSFGNTGITQQRECLIAVASENNFVKFLLAKKVCINNHLASGAPHITPGTIHKNILFESLGERSDILMGAAHQGGPLGLGIHSE